MFESTWKAIRIQCAHPENDKTSEFMAQFLKVANHLVFVVQLGPHAWSALLGGPCSIFV